MVRRLLADAGRDDLVEPAQLLVSEVVTNALVHSATPIDVSMAATPEGVLVEVGDGSQHIPQPRRYAPTANTGRGLALLDSTADAWGVVPGVRGKTVWFQLSSADDDSGLAGDTTGQVAGDDESPGADMPSNVFVLRPADTGPVADQLEESGSSTVTVTLLNMPLLLHAAWQQHAEGVLREHLLAQMDLENADDCLAQHAAATDALSVLEEQVPRPDLGVRPEELMSNAVDPRMSAERIDVQVPRSSVANFAALDAILDEAVQMAERGELLVPMVQPEMRMLRRWLCAQVARQADGSAVPAPWPPPEVLHAPPRRETDWDPRPVADADVAMIAADDTDLIVAVSRSAVDLLGYDDPSELVGHRLITIIPNRYRQAHLAGFALHLLDGRSPLLDGPVQVPALRRDGTERTVELAIEAHRLGMGHCVFVAQMRAVEPAG
jgi:PAS domain S-box-containing protein